MKTRDGWWFCVFYSVTFGGFVGLTSSLCIFFHDQYGLTAIQSGNVVTLLAVVGSFIRPLGGHLSDCFGGIRMLVLLFLGMAIAMGGMSFLPSMPTAIVLLFAGMSMLGMGNGAIFQLVSLRYPREIGVMTGLVGAAGGIGGFLLPTILGGPEGDDREFLQSLCCFRPGRLDLRHDPCRCEPGMGAGVRWPWWTRDRNGLSQLYVRGWREGKAGTWGR